MRKDLESLQNRKEEEEAAVEEEKLSFSAFDLFQF